MTKTTAACFTRLRMTPPREKRRDGFRSRGHGHYRRFAGGTAHADVSAARGIKSFDELEKLHVLFHVSRLRELDELWYRLAVNRHEVAVGVVGEQLGSSFQDVLVMLDQPFRPRVRLAHFALPIAAEEPVV